MELSVVIPAYNAAKHIRPTLESVLDGDGIPMEVIVVDDGSEDDLEGVLEPFVKSGKVKLIRQANSGGPASPRNKGVVSASGEFVLFLDADDVVVTEQLRPTLELLSRHPDVTMVCGNFDVTDAELNVRIPRNIDRYETLNAVLRDKVDDGAWIIPSNSAVTTLLQTNFIGTSSVIARRDALMKVGQFDETMRNLDDRDMWVRLAQRGPILYRGEVFYRYRDVPGSVSKQRELEQFRERIKVADKVLASSTDQKIRREARKWRARSMLKMGYILFHEQGKRGEARQAFAASVSSWPTFEAFKGVIKSLLPSKLYRLVAKT